MRGVVLVLAAALALAAGAKLVKRDAEKGAEDLAHDIEDEVTGFFGSIWGGRCVDDNQCLSVVSYCSKEESTLGLIGECRVNWWIFLVAALLVLLLVGACCACICLPCCCLYTCCTSILDILCCCCRSKGYSPASRG